MTPLPQKNSSPWVRSPICYPALFWHAYADKKLIIEIGPGRGDFLFHLARENPTAGIIGIELKSKRYFKLIDRVKKAGLNNVCLIQADARLAVERYFAPESVAEIHINFPDPWPKRRHEKKRLLDKDFLLACAKILSIGGSLYFATDSKPYFSFVTETAVSIKELRLAEGEKFDFPTFFAKKWEAQGRKIYFCRWAYLK